MPGHCAIVRRARRQRRYEWGMTMTPVRRSLLAAFLAMCLQAAWAAYVNSAHGTWIAGRSALVQGVSSFCMTYLVTLLMERLLAWLQEIQPAHRMAVTATAAIGAMLAVQSGAHWLAGTPHIVATIAPAASIGTLYCISYTAGRTYFGKTAG